MSDTIRDIINNIRGDDYGPMNYENYEEAEQAIKAYVLGAVMELIGADEENYKPYLVVRHKLGLEANQTQAQLIATATNLLRKELRTKLKEYFNA